MRCFTENRAAKAGGDRHFRMPFPGQTDVRHQIRYAIAPSQNREAQQRITDVANDSEAGQNRHNFRRKHRYDCNRANERHKYRHDLVQMWKPNERSAFVGAFTAFLPSVRSGCAIVAHPTKSFAIKTVRPCPSRNAPVPDQQCGCVAA